MNATPPTKSERLLFLAQALVLGAVGTALAALLFAWITVARGDGARSVVFQPSVIDHLAFFAQVFLCLGVLLLLLWELVRWWGRRSHIAMAVLVAILERVLRGRGRR